MGTIHHPGRNDWNKKRRLLDAVRYLFLPKCAVRDSKSVLPNAEIITVAAKLRAQLYLDSVAKLRQYFIEVHIIFALIAEESDQA